jgi:hypothetical protein
VKSQDITLQRNLTKERPKAYQKLENAFPFLPQHYKSTLQTNKHIKIGYLNFF